MVIANFTSFQQLSQRSRPFSMFFADFQTLAMVVFVDFQSFSPIFNLYDGFSIVIADYDFRPFFDGLAKNSKN